MRRKKQNEDEEGGLTYNSRGGYPGRGGMTIRQAVIRRLFLLIRQHKYKLLSAFILYLLVVYYYFFLRPDIKDITGKYYHSNCWVPTLPLPNGEGEWQSCALQFIVAGAMKSGTTSLFSYLIQHPQVLPLRQYTMLTEDEDPKGLGSYYLFTII